MNKITKITIRRIQKFNETGDSNNIYQNVFNIKWHMKILNIYLEEQLLIKYYV